MKQTLDRNASPVQADTAWSVFLDHEDPLAELGQADCGHVPGRAAADDEYVRARTRVYQTVPLISSDAITIRWI